MILQKLGRNVGSPQNYLYANALNTIAPEVGMGATIISWTDRHAGTIISVDPKDGSFVVQEDAAARTDPNGMSDSQSYVYTPNPDGITHRFAKVRSGKAKGLYREGGKQAGRTVMIGERDHYYDFSF